MRCQRIDELSSSSQAAHEVKAQLRERLGIEQLKQNISAAGGASVDVCVDPDAPEGQRIPLVLLPLGRFAPGEAANSTVAQATGRLPESVSIYYERGVDPQSMKGQKLLIKLGSRELSMATKAGLRGAAEAGKEAVEELRKEETQVFHCFASQSFSPYKPDTFSSLLSDSL